MLSLPRFRLGQPPNKNPDHEEELTPRPHWSMMGTNRLQPMKTVSDLLAQKGSGFVLRAPLRELPAPSDQLVELELMLDHEYPYARLLVRAARDPNEVSIVHGVCAQLLRTTTVEDFVARLRQIVIDDAGHRALDEQRPAHEAMLRKSLLDLGLAGPTT